MSLLIMYRSGMERTSFLYLINVNCRGINREGFTMSLQAQRVMRDWSTAFQTFNIKHLRQYQLGHWLERASTSAPSSKYP